MTEMDKHYASFGMEPSKPLPEPPEPVIWPFPSVLRLFKPVGKLPFNPDNHEEAIL